MQAVTFMPLTEEQQAVVNSRSEALKVVAFAGAGKTSTLQAYAKARPERRMLYLAFNKSMAREAAAKFRSTPNVTCLTTHSLAYRAVGKNYRHKLVNNIRSNQAAQALGLDSGSKSNDLSLAFRSLKALKHFLSTSCQDLKEFAFLFPDEKMHKLDAIEGAGRLWQSMCDIGNEAMPMLHDGYLKLYQLSAPYLDYGTILFDEAQDANPVTLAIVKRQSCAKVFVGDPHQQIYQFRYAENAMADPSLTDELLLTKSFRFGEEIAAASNRLLAIKRERNRVTGGRLVPPTSTKACIARGNAALYRRAVHLAKAGKTVRWVGGIKGYQLELLQDIWSLKAGHSSEIHDHFVAGFEDFDAIKDYATSQDERDLKAWIRLIEGHPRWLEIPQEIALVKSRSVTQSEEGTLALATAHKSKGLEFGSVELADDFPEEELANPHQYDKQNHPEFWDAEGFKGGVLLSLEEINLRYVAITRAETSCISGQWSAPLFGKLTDYIIRHPRFITLEELSALRVSSSTEKTPEIYALEAPAVSDKSMVRIFQLARDMRRENQEVLNAAIRLGFAANSHSSLLSRDECAVIRNLLNENEGQLHALNKESDSKYPVDVDVDDSQTSRENTKPLLQDPRVFNISAVVCAYERGYPLVRWDLLANRWLKKNTDAEELIIGHPLNSAHGIISEFIDALARAKNNDKSMAVDAAESGPSVPTMNVDASRLLAEVAEEGFPQTDSWNFVALNGSTLSKNFVFSYETKADICYCTGKSQSDVQRAMDKLDCKEPFSLVIADRLAAILTGDPSIKRAFDRLFLLDEVVDLSSRVPSVEGTDSNRDHDFAQEIPCVGHQLGEKLEPQVLDQRVMPCVSFDTRIDSISQGVTSRSGEILSNSSSEQKGFRSEFQQGPYALDELEIETEDYFAEVQLLDRPDPPSFREWDDIDNFWNQEGVFEEMSDQYWLDEDCEY